MNVLVTLNSTYITPLIVLLTSLLDSHPETHFTLYLLHSSLTEEDFKRITDHVDSNRCQVESIWVRDEMLADAPVGYHFSKEMYYRIFAARLLPANLDRILYLDPDMIVLNPLDDLYEMELGNNFFVAAASPNKAMQKLHLLRLGLPEDNTYFNSGMMLFNLQALRAEQDEGQVLTYLEENKDLLQLPDQDLLNALYGDRTIIVDPLYYNFDVRYFPYYAVLPAGRRMVNEWVQEHTCVLHYCGKNKPFKVGYNGPMEEYYTDIADRLGLVPIDAVEDGFDPDDPNDPDSPAGMRLTLDLEELFGRRTKRKNKN